MRHVIAIAACLTALPALAAPAAETTSVSTAGLDLASVSGQRRLDMRVASAVDRLCGTPVFFTQDETAALDACRADARAQIAPQVRAAVARAGTTLASN